MMKPRIKPDFESKDSRPCKSCKGAGEMPKWPDNKMEPCWRCGGLKLFPAPDYVALTKALIATKGKNKGGLRASKPEPSKGYFAKTPEGVFERRVYATWRWTRFHSGQDVTLPMMAMMDIEGDPFFEEIETLAEVLAFKLTGRRSAGVARWGSALLGVDAPAGLADSAYPSGRVADANKPESELAELI